MRITLLHPYNGDQLQRHRFNTGHLGLAYVGACLLRAGHMVKVLDAKTEVISDEDLLRHVKEFQPDIFGVTAMTHEIHAAAHACAVAKAACYDVLTVVGGPHVSALPERTLMEFPSINIAVTGEGERTMLELAEIARAGRGPSACQNILGIAFRNSDSVQLNARRPWIEDLDELPMPAWHLFPKLPWPVFASRGCPFGCVFCQRVMGRRVRLRSVDNVIAELDALEDQYGQRDGWFQDETFGVSRRWMDEFLEKMIERKVRRGAGYTWGCNSRVNLSDVTLYRRMREAGCRWLSFGIESGNDEILKRIQKGTTREMSIRAVRAARQAGMRTNAFFIIGHPGETWRTALQTASLAAKCGADSLAVGVMVPYPGTEVWSMARKGEYGYKLLSEDWRVYDKYFGNALAIRGLSHRMLEFLQAVTYLWYYAYKLRGREFLDFFWRFHRQVWHLFKRVFHLTGLQSREIPQRLQ